VKLVCEGCVTLPVCKNRDFYLNRDICKLLHDEYDNYNDMKKNPSTKKYNLYLKTHEKEINFVNYPELAPEEVDLS